jgi:F-type H+-transporting ATPase subunit k
VLLLQLAMSILGGLFGGIYLATSGSSKKQVQTPPINAGSKDEEKFVQYVPPSYLLCPRDSGYLLPMTSHFSNCWGS